MNEAYLTNEGHQFTKTVCILIRVALENLPYAVIMVPLLQKLFLVSRWVSFDEIL